MGSTVDMIAAQAQAQQAPSAGNGSWAFLDEQYRKRRVKYEEDEEEKRPLEVVKIGKGKSEVVTGIVQAVPPLPAWRNPGPDSEVAKLVAKNAAIVKRNRETERAFRKRIRAIIAADDEWLLMQ
jgi:hypothetical protein